MSLEKMMKAKAAYDKFMNEKKSKGMSHKDALSLWKEQKGSVTKQSTSISVSSKPKPRKKSSTSTSKAGFNRPQGLLGKLKRETVRSRIKMDAISR